MTVGLILKGIGTAVHISADLESATSAYEELTNEVFKCLNDDWRGVNELIVLSSMRWVE